MKYDYPFTNSIVFALVMRDCDRCRQMLQIIFPDREIDEVKLHEGYVNTEQTIMAGIEPRKIRLDVLFKDSTAWYDIEMQVRNENDLSKRTRYAHSILDVDTLKAGQEYNELKPSYVIFLCCFDFFQQNKPIYRFSMQEEDNHLPLGDETYTIILNSKASDKASLPKPLQDLFQYMNTSIAAEDNEFLQQIDHSVEQWNTGEGRRMLMTLEQEILIKEAKARKEGYTEGHDKGYTEGNNNGYAKGSLDTLIKLVTDGKITIDTGAEHAGMPIEEFQKAVNKNQTE